LKERIPSPAEAGNPELNHRDPDASYPGAKRKGTQDMKQPRAIKLGVAVATLALTLVAVSVWAGPTQRYLVPQQMALPLYVTGLDQTGTNADDWVVAAFYYPSATIPADYDLFNAPVFDYPVGFVTPLVQGFFVFHDGSPFPLPQLVQNAPGAKVEIWFVPVQKFISNVDTNGNYVWTINSMKAEGAIVGLADSFTQTWEAGTKVDNNTVVASGTMQDGRSFWVKSTWAIGGWQGKAKTVPCIVHFGP
jgi:hypothetical protein